MNRNIHTNTPFSQFEIHQINTSGKVRDSPTSSILKTPTAIFVTTRNSSAKTKKLTFANGPIDLQSLRNGTNESNVSFDSDANTNGEKKLNNGDISFEENIVEVAVSPVKTMKVSPDSWKAFLEYKKRYSDYANEMEKTDYTYSRLSKYHKEIIPGFLFRPNLSRLSITSKRSSFSSPSSHSSINESYQSSNYDFKINHSDSELFNEMNQSNKLGRSKYFLRSSGYDWKETSDTDPSFLKTDYYGQPVVEKITKTHTYKTTEVPEPITYSYGSVRQMDLDDADIDEVDDPSTINQIYSENRYYNSNESNVSRRAESATANSQKSSGYLKNFFTTVLLYITTVGTVPRDLFSKYILKRGIDNEYRSQFGPHDRKSDYYTTYGEKSSWIPWKGRMGEGGAGGGSYSSANYYLGGYYGAPLTWYQRIYYFFSDRFSQFRNLIWGDTLGHSSYRYQDTSTRRRKFWWLLIPLLILAGSFLAYIDFFSNPKTILNIIYNWALFIPSFLHYTFTVFIPSLIFEIIPYFVLKTIPNFIMVTLPYFFINTIPYYFWVVVHFFAGLTLTSVWNAFVGAFTLALNFLLTLGGSVYNIILSLISTGYYLSSKYLILFYSNFCMQMFHLFTILSGCAFYVADCAQHALSFILNLF